jgi:hypothetical protein
LWYNINVNKRNEETKMYGQYVRLATEEEIATREMVETKLGDRADEAFDLICDEEIDDLVDDVIRGEDLLAILEECGITAAQACVWYFVE